LIVTKLNQIIAVEKGAKSRTQRELTDAYHRIQKPALLAGISRTYRPRDEEGETLPPESTRVQVKAEAVLRDAAEALTRLFDVVATKEWGNTQAAADVVVDGTTIITQVPVPYLLFLEKQLTDLKTFIDKLPTLDAAETWTFDESQDVWRSDEVETARTKKIPRNHVKYEATDKHPAQVEMYYEDIVVGTWTKVAFSGALPARRVNELRDRVNMLQDAVRQARETANGIEVEDRRVGAAIFAYLLA
jgi:hypothetical protein